MPANDHISLSAAARGDNLDTSGHGGHLDAETNRRTRMATPDCAVIIETKPFSQARRSSSSCTSMCWKIPPRQERAAGMIDTDKTMRDDVDDSHRDSRDARVIRCRRAGKRAADVFQPFRRAPAGHERIGPFDQFFAMSGRARSQAIEIARSANSGSFLRSSASSSEYSSRARRAPRRRRPSVPPCAQYVRARPQRRPAADAAHRSPRRFARAYPG